MNWTLAIIQAILIAGISALISYIISTRQKRLDFTYDYRKYILDKRKEAYSQIEKIIPLCKQKNQIIITHSNFDFSSFIEINDAIGAVKENFGFWISPRIDQMLYQIRKDFLSARLNDNVTSKEEIAERMKYWGRIYKTMIAIEECYFLDIMTLDNIEAFKKAKTAQHTQEIEETNKHI
jgi:hypothetical protein